MNAWHSFELTVLLQVTAITLGAAIALGLARRRAALRHAMGVVALAMVLASPALALLLPKTFWLGGVAREHRADHHPADRDRQPQIATAAIIAPPDLPSEDPNRTPRGDHSQHAAQPHFRAGCRRSWRLARPCFDAGLVGLGRWGGHRVPAFFRRAAADSLFRRLDRAGVDRSPGRRRGLSRAGDRATSARRRFRLGADAAGAGLLAADGCFAASIGRNWLGGPPARRFDSRVGTHPAPRSLDQSRAACCLRPLLAPSGRPLVGAPDRPLARGSVRQFRAGRCEFHRLRPNASRTGRAMCRPALCLVAAGHVLAPLESGRAGFRHPESRSHQNDPRQPRAVGRRCTAVGGNLCAGRWRRRAWRRFPNSRVPRRLSRRRRTWPSRPRRDSRSARNENRKATERDARGIRPRTRQSRTCRAAGCARNGDPGTVLFERLTCAGCKSAGSRPLAIRWRCNGDRHDWRRTCGTAGRIRGARASLRRSSGQRATAGCRLEQGARRKEKRVGRRARAETHQRSESCHRSRR